jgi:hypothetical protein
VQRATRNNNKRTRPRRHEHPRGVHRADLIHGLLVIFKHDKVGAQVAQVLFVFEV